MEWNINGHPETIGNAQFGNLASRRVEGILALQLEISSGLLHLQHMAYASSLACPMVKLNKDSTELYKGPCF